MIDHNDIDNGHITSRMHKVCCCTSLCCACNPLFQPCRKAVSGSKRRIRKDGFDLDMAYIAPRIIIHGFPAAGLEHIYRNPRLEIRRFMDKYHKDHYKMYNFCCEYGRGYDPSVFHGRVERYPFKDHNTPPLETMAAFANSVKAWLEADEQNVVNMHCKAGKGRAGLMGCVALIRTGVAQSAVEALEIYDRERVTNNKGLTVTSQRKFVVFYEKLWRECWGVTGNIGDIPAEPLDSTKYVVPEQPSRRLFGIEVVNLPPGLVGCVRVRVYRISNFLPECMYDSKVMKTGSVNLDVDVTLKGNFKVAVEFSKGGLLEKRIKLMELLHNTYFMDWTADSVDFALDQLDTKKKVRPKLGTAIAMRLRFVQSAAQRDGEGAVAGGGGKDGYALVASEGDAAVLGAEGGAATTTAASASPGKAAQRGVEMSTMAVSGASGKTAVAAAAAASASASPKSGKGGKSAMKTEAAFTSLMSSGKGGLETVVL